MDENQLSQRALTVRPWKLLALLRGVPGTMSCSDVNEKFEEILEQGAAIHGFRSGVERSSTFRDNVDG